MSHITEVYYKDDVTDEVKDAAMGAAEWFEDEARVDWDSYWDRLEQYGVFVSDTVSPAAKEIERLVREWRRL